MSRRLLLLSFGLPLLAGACVWESVVREPTRAHRDRHHGDLTLSEQEVAREEAKRTATTPLNAEEAGFMKRFLDEARFVKVYYVRRGAGEGHPALFLLGGLEHFEPLGRRLESACDVVYVTPARSSRSLAEQARDVETIRKGLDLDKVFVLGVGDLAAVALEYGAAFPEQTAGVIWIHGPGDGQAQIRDAYRHLASVAGTPAEQERLARQILRESFNPLDSLRALAATATVTACRQPDRCERSLAHSRDAAARFAYPASGAEEPPDEPGWLTETRQPDYRAARQAEALRGVRILLLHGRHDPLRPAERATELQQELADSMLTVLESSQSRPDLEEPAAVLEQVAGFVDVLPLPPPSPTPLLPDWRPAYDPGNLPEPQLDRRARELDLQRRRARVDRLLAQACAELRRPEAAAEHGLPAADLDAFLTELCPGAPDPS